MKYIRDSKRFVERAVESPLHATHFIVPEAGTCHFFPLSDVLSSSWRSVVVILALARSRSHVLQHHAASSLYLAVSVRVDCTFSAFGIKA